MGFIRANFSNVKLPTQRSLTFNFKYLHRSEIISLFNPSFNPSTTRLVHFFGGPLIIWHVFCLKVLGVFQVNCHSYVGVYYSDGDCPHLFWPVTQKANASMKKMQLVQPKCRPFAKVRAGCGSDECQIMELYRAEGVNPLGGCFAILLQIPVFFALSRVGWGGVVASCSVLVVPDLAGGTVGIFSVTD